MSIYERTIELTKDEMNTLLFLTGKQRIVKRSELSKAEIHNVNTFFGKEIHEYEIFLKLIIYRDKVIIKFKNNYI